MYWAFTKYDTLDLYLPAKKLATCVCVAETKKLQGVLMWSRFSSMAARLLLLLLFLLPFPVVDIPVRLSLSVF